MRRTRPDPLPPRWSIPASDDVISAWLAAALAFLLVAGCENTIEPYAEKGAYSVHGVLFPSRDVQLVRVKPLSTPVTKVDSGTVNATVTLENVTEGLSEVLRDSIIPFEDAETEVITHNFWTDTPVPPETKYRLSVEGPHGSVQATTVTPTGTDAEITPKEGDCYDRYTVIFEDVEDRRRVQASWEVKLEGMPAQFSRGKWAFFTLNNPYVTEEGEVAVSFRPADTLGKLSRELYSIPSPPPLPDSLNKDCWSSNLCAILGSNKLRVRYTYLGPAWYGDVPEDSLTYDPLQSRDVSGGLGFFGAARRDRIFATLDTSPFFWAPGFFCNQPPPGS